MSTTLPISSLSIGSSDSQESCNDVDGSPSPNLAFIRLEDMHLQEDYRPSREEQLASRINTDGFLANPLIVSHVFNRVFALDGHHRRECLRRMGCSHALIQHVPLWDERRLVFDMWSHAAQVEFPDEILAELRSYGLVVNAIAACDAESHLSSDGAICWLAVYDWPRCRIYAVSSGSRRWIDALQILTSLYQPTRITSRELPSAAFRKPQSIFKTFRHTNLFVRFAPIDRRRIADLAATNERIPCGITRTILPAGRVLGVNVPLNLLRQNATNAGREEWLTRLQQKTPVVYRPPTTINEAPSARRYDDLLYVYDPRLTPTGA